MNSIRIIGCMSGSSLDGLDMALCRLEGDAASITWCIEAAQTLSYSDEWVKQLQQAPSLSGRDLMRLDARFGRYIGQSVATWMKEQRLTADLIASHGHTVFHEPQFDFTTQIGSGAHIVVETGLDTITTFRAADIASGGQGAPFAPVADRHLLTGYDGYINLGGIVNASVRLHGDRWKAWDIGPCNQVLNFLAAKTGVSFDSGGNMASKGNIQTDVVHSLLTMYPAQEGAPRGLSNQHVYSTWIQYLETEKHPVENLLASVSEAISRMILDHLIPHMHGPARILVTGGGAHNHHLIQRLRLLGEPHGFQFELPEKILIDFKECLLMAILGWMTLQNVPYGIDSITGAAGDTIGGAIFRAVR